MADPPPPFTENVAHIGYVIGAIMDDFAISNPDVNLFGPEDDAANAAPKSLYWCPLSESMTPPVTQGKPGAAGSLYTRRISVSFLLFGGIDPNHAWDSEDPKESAIHGADVTEIMLSRLINSMHRLLSQKSYELGDTTWYPGGRTGDGMACETLVTFNLPLVREDNPVVTATDLDVTVEIDHS